MIGLLSLVFNSQRPVKCHKARFTTPAEYLMPGPSRTPRKAVQHGLCYGENMKATFLLLGITALPLLVGCNDAESATGADNQPAVAASTNAAPESALPTSLAPSNVVIQAEPPAARVINKELTPPASVKLSPAAAEIAKMASAGVDASVMQAYIASSVNTYRLSAEEIVYLNDLGVSSEVMSAMIRHDQQIRGASVQGAVAASPATPASGGSVWNDGQTANTSNVWQETAAAPVPEAEVQTTVPPPPQEEVPAQVTVNYFYDSLSPYGTWVDVDGYGRCWRPTVVATSPGWRPYVHGGRWVWTDAGWYWYSDYSWGWAPFHYGRWFSHARLGWCWVPGTVWGPSWVSWRYNDGYCGWAPLPPAASYYPSVGFTYYGRSCGTSFSFGLTWDYFTFVSYNRFYGRHYDRYCTPRHETARIYNNTTVINNVIVGDNNTIINQGIGPDRISRVTRSEIPRATVNQLAGNGGPRGGRHETLAPDGRTVSVVQHQVPGGRGPVRLTSSTPAAEPITTPAPVLPEPTRTGRSETGRPNGPSAPTRNSVASSETRGGSSVLAPTVAEPSSTRGSFETANTRPTRPSVTRSPGALHIQGNPNPPTTARTTTGTPTTVAATPATPQPNASATPWLNNNPSRTERSTAPTWQSSPTRAAEANNNPMPSGRVESSGYSYNGGGNRFSSPAAVSTRPTPTPRATTTPATPWQSAPRPQNSYDRPSPSSGGGSSYNSPAPAPESPRYTAPRQSAAPPQFSPAPVTRIERPAPAAPPARSEYSAPPRSAPPAASSGGDRPSGRGQSASSSASSGDNNARPGRPGR